LSLRFEVARPSPPGEGLAVCLGGYENGRTTPVITFAALLESRVKARAELPLITESVTASSGIV
jgi:hypothetical protein